MTDETANDQPKKAIRRPIDRDGPPTDEEVLDAVISGLKTIYDPEIPVNIYDLGLIYKIDVDDFGNVAIEMTLTAPGCPVAQTFPGEIREVVESLDEVQEASVEVVWEPMWTTDNMSEAAKLQLGMV